MTTRIIQMVGYKSTGAPRFFQGSGENEFILYEAEGWILPIILAESLAWHSSSKIHLECIAPGYPKKQAKRVKNDKLQKHPKIIWVVRCLSHFSSCYSCCFIQQIFIFCITVFQRFQWHPMDAPVVVVGLGGVGSHCAHALLRGVLPGGSVRRLRLIDFDRVSLSSLNRHAVALRCDAP